MRSWPVESAAGPMKKIPCRGRVTVWLSLMASDSWSRTFAFGLTNAARRFSCPAYAGGVPLIRQDPRLLAMLPAHGRAELDLGMHTEPLLTVKKRGSSYPRRTESPGAFNMLDMTLNVPVWIWILDRR